MPVDPELRRLAAFTLDPAGGDRCAGKWSRLSDSNRGPELYEGPTPPMSQGGPEPGAAYETVSSTSASTLNLCRGVPATPLSGGGRAGAVPIDERSAGRQAAPGR
jgi:hypothetical protein